MFYSIQCTSIYSHRKWGINLIRRYLNWNSIFSHTLVNLSYSRSQFSAPIDLMKAIGVENRKQNNGHCN